MIGLRKSEAERERAFEAEARLAWLLMLFLFASLVPSAGNRFPQLYVNGELIGGLDIVKEMVSSGELKSVLAEAKPVGA